VKACSTWRGRTKAIDTATLACRLGRRGLARPETRAIHPSRASREQLSHRLALGTPHTVAEWISVSGSNVSVDGTKR
jgi:hypothetical protein